MPTCTHPQTGPVTYWLLYGVCGCCHHHRSSLASFPPPPCAANHPLAEQGDSPSRSCHDWYIDDDDGHMCHVATSKCPVQFKGWVGILGHLGTCGANANGSNLLHIENFSVKGERSKPLGLGDLWDFSFIYLTSQIQGRESISQQNSSHLLVSWDLHSSARDGERGKQWQLLFSSWHKHAYCVHTYTQREDPCKHFSFYSILLIMVEFYESYRSSQNSRPLV